MLSYDMSQRGDLPLYEHLYRCIKNDILQGVIVCDEQLPSKRRLSQHLGVSLITVEGAYNQLLAEGYIYAKPRQGYFVCKLAAGASALQAGAIAAAAATPQRSNQDRNAQPAITSPDKQSTPLVADLTQSDTRCPKFAADLWGKALRASLTHEPQEELFTTLGAQGSPRLQNAIASYLRRARGMEVDPSCIVIGAGAQTLYTYVSLLFGTSAPIALENPGYPHLKNIYTALGHTACPIDVDKEGANVFQLERTRAQLAHVIPSHQFPTGHVMSISRRYELLGWAARRNERYIIEDDYDWEFRFGGKPIPALQSIDTNSKVVYIGTFSKSLAASLRIAFMVLPASLMERFNKRLGFMGSTVSTLDQVTLARLIESGDYERHLSRYRKQCRRTRDELVAALETSRIAQRTRVLEKDSGLHFVLEVQSALTDTQIADALRAKGVLLKPLSAYLIANRATKPTDDGWAHFVVQYEELDHSAIARVIELLEQSID